MHKYRLYVYDAEDRQIAPAMVIAADNDDAATEQAKNMLDGVRAELTDDDRLVMRFPKDQRPARLFSYPNPKNHNYSDHQEPRLQPTNCSDVSVRTATYSPFGLPPYTPFG